MRTLRPIRKLQIRMKRQTYIRSLFLIIVVSVSFILFAYTRIRASHQEDCNNESGKCPQKKTQSEYILWESLTRNLLSISR